MAWFLNIYRCARCKRIWTDEWSCMCDDDCPHCGARHMSPRRSDELTYVIKKKNDEYVVLRSPQTAEHTPDYCEMASFRTREQAKEYAALDELKLYELRRADG